MAFGISSLACVSVGNDLNTSGPCSSCDEASTYEISCVRVGPNEVVLEADETLATVTANICSAAIVPAMRRALGILMGDTIAFLPVAPFRKNTAPIEVVFAQSAI
jgi:hypothetical protein